MIAPAIQVPIEERRKDFPILRQEVRPGVPLIYLDSAATAQKPDVVIETVDRYYRETNSNVHRGIHTLSEKATTAYEAARDKVRNFIHAASSIEIVFTRNTTESINLVAYSWGLSTLKPGDEVILTEMEHHANIVPWQMVTERQGATIHYVQLTPDGQLDMADYARLLSSGRVKLVGVVHASNVLGTVNPLAEIIKQAHAAGALVLVDAAQSAPHLPLDVQALDIDFLAFSGHKAVGPTGIGVLYGKRDLLREMPPFLGGGSMIRKVTFERSTYADLPQKFEAGTPAIAQAIGLGAALDYLTEIGLEAIQAHEHRLTSYTMDALNTIPNLKIIGPNKDHRIGVIAFTIKGVHPHDVAQGLDSVGIAVRAGHHCTMPLHDKLGLPATSRASFYLYNTIDEADKLIEALNKIRAMFARRG